MDYEVEGHTVYRAKGMDACDIRSRAYQEPEGLGKQELDGIKA